MRKAGNYAPPYEMVAERLPPGSPYSDDGEMIKFIRKAVQDALHDDLDQQGIDAGYLTLEQMDLVQQRKALRAEGRYEKADAIRKTLHDVHDIRLEDKI